MGKRQAAFEFDEIEGNSESGGRRDGRFRGAKTNLGNPLFIAAIWTLEEARKTTVKGIFGRGVEGRGGEGKRLRSVHTSELSSCWRVFN